MNRPYMSEGIADLENLAKANLGDSTIITNIIAELGHRKSGRARNLLAQLQRGSLSKVVENQPVPGKKEKSTKTATTSSETVPSVVIQPPSSAFRTLQEAYDILRETFTEDSEKLARWGMTSELPISIRKLVFNEWKKTVKNEPDIFGRSLDRLLLDMDELLVNDKEARR